MILIDLRYFFYNCTPTFIIKVIDVLLLGQNDIYHVRLKKKKKRRVRKSLFINTTNNMTDKMYIYNRKLLKYFCTFFLPKI